eukprot:7383377-Prymnesium_polylepis.1
MHSASVSAAHAASRPSDVPHAARCRRQSSHRPHRDALSRARTCSEPVGSRPLAPPSSVSSSSAPAASPAASASIELSHAPSLRACTPPRLPLLPPPPPPLLLLPAPLLLPPPPAASVSACGVASSRQAAISGERRDANTPRAGSGGSVGGTCSGGTERGGGGGGGGGRGCMPSMRVRSSARRMAPSETATAGALLSCVGRAPCATTPPCSLRAQACLLRASPPGSPHPPPCSPRAGACSPLRSP